MEAAEGEFDAFLTAGRGISYQQDPSSFDITVVILEVKSSSYQDPSPLMERVNEALPGARPGEPVRVRR